MKIDLPYLFYESHIKNFADELWSFFENAPPNHFSFYQLNPNVNALDMPKVFFALSLIKGNLCLSFFIENNNWLKFDDVNLEKSHREDFLWEKNCLECFVAIDNENAYLEINVSPNSNYNVYRFDSYRHPNDMPPRRDSEYGVVLKQNFEKLEIDGWYQRHFAFLHLNNSEVLSNISHINPCVILYNDNEPIFYAVNHANPPDFHDKQYWLDF